MQRTFVPEHLLQESWHPRERVRKETPRLLMILVMDIEEEGMNAL